MSIIKMELFGQEWFLPKEKVERIIRKKYCVLGYLNRVTEVDYKAIDKNIFLEEREDPEQEKIRTLILEAFKAVEARPQYKRKFRYIVPKWDSTYKFELGDILADIKKIGKMADWIEHVLQLAQRIAELGWEAVCNKEDQEADYRLILWKDNCVHTAGGSQIYKKRNYYREAEPEAYVSDRAYPLTNDADYWVPTIVLYNEE